MNKLINYIYIGSEKRLGQLKLFKEENFEKVTKLNFSNEREIRDLLDSEVADFDDYDYWVPVGEVPVALGVTQDQVPIEPYLEPTEEYITKWKRIIPPSDKFKIGVRWTGHQQYEEAGGTIIPAQYFE